MSPTSRFQSIDTDLLTSAAKRRGMQESLTHRTIHGWKALNETRRSHPLSPAVLSMHGNRKLSRDRLAAPHVRGRRGRRRGQALTSCNEGHRPSATLRARYARAPHAWIE